VLHVLTAIKCALLYLHNEFSGFLRWGGSTSQTSPPRRYASRGGEVGPSIRLAPPLFAKVYAPERFGSVFIKRIICRIMQFGAAFERGFGMSLGRKCDSATCSLDFYLEFSKSH
jgi:hypothetical protein